MGIVPVEFARYNPPYIPTLPRENAMSLQQDESGRLHIQSPLMAESLMDKTLLASTETDQVFRPMPELNVIKLGGQSIIDRGRQALLPLLQEIAAARGIYSTA